MPPVPPALHFCHECNMEMRPLMEPNPTCPNCGSEFVEELPGLPDPASPTGAATPPTASSSSYSAGGGATFDAASAISRIFSAVTGFNAGGPSGNANAEGSQSASSASSAAPGDRNPSASSSSGSRSGRAQWGPFGVEWHTQSYGPNSYSQTYNFGSSRSRTTNDGMGGAGGASDGRFFHADDDDDDGDDSRTQRSPPQPSHSDPFGHLFNSPPGGGHASPNADRDYTQAGGPPPQLAALQGLIADLFGGGGGDGSDSPHQGPSLPSMLGSLLSGLGGGQMGDYVFGQQGLDDVISRMMEETQGNTAPPPASEDAIAELKRFKATDQGAQSQARNRECPTCLDTIIESNDATAMDSVATTSSSTDDDYDDPPEVAAGEEPISDVLILLPCSHAGHEQCIVPWLQRNNTCPICRVALEPGERPRGGAAQQQAQTQGTSSQRHQQQQQPTTPGNGSNPNSRTWSWSFSTGFGGGGGGGSSNANHQQPSQQQPASSMDTPHHPSVSEHMVGEFPDTDEEYEDVTGEGDSDADARSEDEHSPEERRRRIREAAEKRMAAGHDSAPHASAHGQGSSTGSTSGSRAPTSGTGPEDVFDLD